MNFIGWLATAIIVPVALPFLLVGLCLHALHIPKDGIYRSVVKDGQLLWISMALCATALFDTASDFEKFGHVKWLLVTWYGAILVICSILISFWTVGLVAPKSESGGSSAAGAATTSNAFTLKEDALVHSSWKVLGATAVVYAAMKGYLMLKP